MSNGHIIDAYPDNKKNLMITWISTKNKPVKITEKYQPSFYIHSNRENIITLATILRDNQQVENQELTYEKITLGKDTKKLVLKVTPKRLEHFNKLAETIDSWGGYYRYQLYNVDLRLSTRYLQEKGVFCNAFVRYDGKKLILDDEQWAIDYKTPRYKSITIDIKRKTKSKIISFETPIESIKVEDNLISEKNEIDTILLMVKKIRHLDPDILLVKKGDSVLFPYILHRAKIHKIQNSLILGRDEKPLKTGKQAKSYFSYGHIVYRPAFYTLRGRAHLDTYNSFMYGESGLIGLIDISRCSNIPLQILSRVGPGTAISQMQVNKAIEKGFLVPWKKNIPENWKTAMNLLVSDRGGLILDPVVGLHEDIIELDFASLYPNVMLRFNISPETILCDCCKFFPKIKVPQLGYHICVNRIGLIPEVLKPVLYRRFCYKARSKNKKYDVELYKELQQAWKWILLVCFGYTGYRNARYGRIECYESITAFARDILLSAIETVEDAGYSVLHGIIDSLWIKPKPGCVKPTKLSRMISNNTGVRMDLEGHYKWIVFLPSKNLDVGALNRYYGMFDDGKIKVRGIELRQKNSPVFLNNMQKDMLNVFSKADTKK
jgi:DNA polymerase elongation subunit (family B)